MRAYKGKRAFARSPRGRRLRAEGAVHANLARQAECASTRSPSWVVNGQVHTFQTPPGCASHANPRTPREYTFHSPDRGSRLRSSFADAHHHCRWSVPQRSTRILDIYSHCGHGRAARNLPLRRIAVEHMEASSVCREGQVGDVAAIRVRVTCLVRVNAAWFGDHQTYHSWRISGSH